MVRSHTSALSPFRRFGARLSLATILLQVVGGSFFSVVLPVEIAAAANTLVVLGAVANPSTYGDMVNFTATVTGVAAYTGTMTFKQDGVDISGPVAVDSVTGIALFSTSTIDAGTYNMTAVYSGDGGGNEPSDPSIPVSLTVNPQVLNIISATGVDRWYNGVINVNVDFTDDRVVGDNVTYGYSALMADKTVGAAKAVTIGSVSINGGTDAGNYVLNPGSVPAATTVNISPRPINVIPAITNKVYDGMTTASVSLTHDGVVGDDLILGYGTADFDTKDVGANKIVHVTGLAITGGADAVNYTVTNLQSWPTADITPLSITVTAQTDTKTYDGNNTSGVAPAITGTVIPGDTAGFVQTFDTKNTGTNKTLTPSGSVNDGNGGNDYAVTFVTDSTGQIDKAQLNMLTATGVDRWYNGVINVNVDFTDDRVVGDNVTYGYSALMADKTVGPAKAVTISGISINGGTDANNYVLNTTIPNTTVNISQRPLTVDATVLDKIYDGTTAATINAFSHDGVLSDDVQFTANAAFDNANVGNNKDVFLTNIAFAGGADDANYFLTTTLNYAIASVTPGSLTLSVSANDKVYDGNNSAVANVNLVAPPAGVSIAAGYTATFSDEDAAAGKPVTITGITLTGPNAANYSIPSVAVTTASITQATLTVTSTADSKVYDSTTAAVPHLSFGIGPVGGDTVTLSYGTADFDTKDVGTNKTVTVNGILLSGADAGNYTANASTTANADVTARPITVTAQTDTKTYDGTTNSAGTPAITAGSLAGTETATFSQTFDTKDAGVGKTLTPTGSVSDGNGGANYAITFLDNTTGAINAVALTVEADSKTKVYGDADPALTYQVTGGALIVGESFSGNISRAAGEDVNTYAIGQGSLSAGSNYTITFVPSSFTITQRSLNVTATGINKTYDGNATATVNLSDNHLGGDVVNLSYTTASFANKTVGNGKAVSVSGISITGGAQAGNYSLTNTTASTSADITAASLTVSAAGVNKVYDGNTTATVNVSDNHIGSDVVNLNYVSASFNTKNVANGKPVSVSGISISGADASNYTANTTASTSADITPATLNVTASGVNKVYDGTTAATVSYGDNRVGGDTLTISGTAAFSNQNAGNGKTINVTSIVVGGVAAGNYTANTSTTTTANITAVPLTITANAKNKFFGSLDPALTYTLTAGSLVGTDTLTGGLVRVVGENAGTYPINQGTLTGGINYTITFVPGVFTIVPLPVTTTILNSNLNPANGGQTITFTATVSPALVTGTVTFMDGANTIGTSPIVAGTASLSTGLSAGSHDIRATYSGDLNHNSSSSALLTQIVLSLNGGNTNTGNPNGGDSGGGGGGGGRRTPPPSNNTTTVAPGAFGGPTLNTRPLTHLQKIIMCRVQKRMSTMSANRLAALVSRLARRFHLTPAQIQIALNDKTLCQ